MKVTDPNALPQKKWTDKLLARALGPRYPLLLGVVAALDYLFFIVPIAPLLVASVALSPKRWRTLAFFVSVGSSLGAFIFWLLIRLQGTVFLDAIAPQMRNGELWKQAQGWIDHYGVAAVFVNSAVPLVDHPAIAVSALSDMHWLPVVLAMVMGKSLKFFLFSWLAAKVKLNKK